MIKHYYMCFSGPLGLIPEDIAYLLAEGEKSPTLPGKHQRSGDLHHSTEVRNNSTSWATSKNAYDILMPFIEAANDLAGWKYDVSVPEGVQISTYKPDQHYTWHIDGNSDHFAARSLVGTNHDGEVLLEQTKNKNLVGLVRKLSVVAQLSDPNDYEGGDLVLSSPTTGEDIDIYGETSPQFREKGAVIVFPSYIRHKVTPVTMGIRKSATAWINGPPFK